LKILIVHRYYWPDKTSCSNIIHGIAKHLAKNKHQVYVLSSQPSYLPENNYVKQSSYEVVDNICIRRLALTNETHSFFWRIINAIHLGVATLFIASMKKYDIIIATSTPPILNGFFSALSKILTKAKLIYFCMDLNPEIGRVSKDFKNYIFFKFLLKLDNWSCKNSNLVLTHSKDMIKSLKQRPGGNKYNIIMMNNFSPKNLKENKIKQLSAKSKKKLSIIYAGNIGRFQGLDTIIDAMGLLFYRKDIELTILGNGVEKEKLEEKVQQKKMNVKFIKYSPIYLTKQIIRNADIGLVSLVPKIYKYAYPSKIATYLEEGKPIICVLEKKSQIVKDILLHGCGFYVKFGDKHSLANLLIRLADNNKWKKRKSQLALKYFNKYFSSKTVLNNWSKIINDLSFRNINY
jgi:glycosyltransferase involved in cell wall biosynthesis